MDKLELDDRVSRLESRVSFHSLVMTTAALVALVAGAAFVTTARVSSSHQEEDVVAVATPIPPPMMTPQLLPPKFEAELRQAHLMQQQGLITPADFDQKKAMILDAPMTFSNEVEAMKAAKSLLTQRTLTEAEYDVLKRKILKFGE